MRGDTRFHLLLKYTTKHKFAEFRKRPKALRIQTLRAFLLSAEVQ